MNDDELLKRIRKLYGIDSIFLLQGLLDLNELGRKNIIESLEILSQIPKYTQGSIQGRIVAFKKG